MCKMGSTLLIHAVFLLSLCQIEGSEAVTPVFVQKGKDVLLEVREANIPEEFIVVQWKFNGSDVLVSLYPERVRVTDGYKGRVDASVGNFSVKLKNLQKADSGVYSAEVTADVKSPTLVKYHVTVLVPASPVELRVDSVSNSSGSCNFTVTCITQDSLHINSSFICTNHACIQEGGERSKVTTSGHSLKVYLEKDSIICNHSNQVSWTRDNNTTEHFCLLHGDAARDHMFVIWLLASISIVAIGAGCAVFFHRQKKKCKSVGMENTVYSTFEVPGCVNQTPTDAGASGVSPCTTYCLVGPHTGPIGSTDAKDPTLPQSLYADVQ